VRAAGKRASLFSSGLLLFSLLFSTPASGERAEGFDAEEITDFVASQMRAFRIPAAAVGIVRGDRVVYLRGFGNADGAGRPVTPQTPFLIGSNSKSLTALAVMQLVESGEVVLDAPVRSYLPWFRLKDEAASGSVTVRQLLNQTSGLPAGAEFAPEGSDNYAHHAAELRRVGLSHPPGRSFEYSDLNYELLGLLVEAVAGEPYDAYVHEHVLEPLAMDSTYLTYEGARAHGLARGYRYLFGLPVPAETPRYAPHSVPAGGVATTAEDFCHFLIAQLNGGAYAGRSVLNQEGVALMHEPRRDLGSTYAMGWFVEEWDGLESVNHMGMNETFSSMINLLPREGYGVVVLTDVNSFSILGRENLMDGIVRRLAGLQRVSYWDEELCLRLLLLAVLLFGLARLAARLRSWRGLGYPLALRVQGGVALALACGLLMVAVWLVVVPLYADACLSELLELQPDIGYGVICGALLSVSNSILGALARSARAPGSLP
jgi:CubicO group peptidase (beta-lactamase class C family)